MRMLIPGCLLFLVAGCAGPDPHLAHPGAPVAPVTDEVDPFPAVPDAPMSIEQAISLALAESARLDPYRIGMQVAREEKNAARDLQDPEIRFAYGESKRTEQLALGTEQESHQRYRGVMRIFPPNPWVRNAVSKAGDARIQLAAANMRAAEIEVAARVHELFQKVRHRRAEREILQRIFDVRREQLEQTEERLSRGAGTSPDVLMARIDSLDARMDSEKAFIDQQRAITDLAAYLGFEDGNELELAFPPIPPPTDWDLEMLTARAFDRRSDLAAVDWRAETAQWDLSAARRVSVPWFAHIQGAYTEEDRADVDENSWSVQAAVELPLFSFRNSDVGIAEAELEQFRADAERARAQVRAEVRRNLAQLRQARTELDRFKQETAPVLEELNASLASDVGNTLSPDDRADLLEGILKAEQLRLESVLAYQRAWIELQIAIGSEWLIQPTNDAPGNE